MQPFLLALLLLVSVPWGTQRSTRPPDVTADVSVEHGAFGPASAVDDDGPGAPGSCGMPDCLDMNGCTATTAAIAVGTQDLHARAVALADAPIASLGPQSVSRCTAPPPPRHLCS